MKLPFPFQLFMLWLTIGALCIGMAILLADYSDDVDLTPLVEEAR